jgi:ABC-type Mn2+/Zn2+ transport system permease subunit
MPVRQMNVEVYSTHAKARSRHCDAVPRHPFGTSQASATPLRLVGVTCATLGVYVVPRRLAFIGDALAHAPLPGLIVAYLNGWSLFGGAVRAGALTALGIGWVSRHQMLEEDTAIGILFTSMSALGILLSSMSRSFRDLSHLSTLRRSRAGLPKPSS